MSMPFPTFGVVLTASAFAATLGAVLPGRGPQRLVGEWNARRLHHTVV